MDCEQLCVHKCCIVRASSSGFPVALFMCMYSIYSCECVYVLVMMSPLGQVMYYSNLSKQKEGWGEWGRGGEGELEECQTLDWISMNSKEADRGDRGKERGGREGETWRERRERERQSARTRKKQTCIYVVVEDVI